MKRIGPEVALEEHSEAFLKAHKKVISGPRIEKGRWVIEKEREHAVATHYIKLLLKQAKSKDRGSIKKALNKKTKVLSDKEVIAKYKKNKEFREYFSTYLKGIEEFEEY